MRNEIGCKVSCSNILLCIVGLSNKGYEQGDEALPFLSFKSPINFSAVRLLRVRHKKC